MVQAAAVFFEVGAGLLDQRSRDWLQLPVRFGLGQHCLWRYDAEASWAMNHGRLWALLLRQHRDWKQFQKPERSHIHPLDQVGLRLNLVTRLVLLGLHQELTARLCARTFVLSRRDWADLVGAVSSPGWFLDGHRCYRSFVRRLRWVLLLLRSYCYAVHQWLSRESCRTHRTLANSLRIVGGNWRLDWKALVVVLHCLRHLNRPFSCRLGMCSSFRTKSKHTPCGICAYTAEWCISLWFHSCSDRWSSFCSPRWSFPSWQL